MTTTRHPGLILDYGDESYHLEGLDCAVGDDGKEVICVAVESILQHRDPWHGPPYYEVIEPSSQLRADLLGLASEILTEMGEGPRLEHEIIERAVAEEVDWWLSARKEGVA